MNYQFEGDKSKEMLVINEYSRDLQKTKNIERRCCGFLVTGPDKVYDGKIHALVLSYSIDKRLNFDEATKLFYEVVDGLIAKVNEQKDLAELFYHYPIDYRDFDISLSFDYENTGHLKKGDVNSIYIANNEISYYIVENEQDSGKIKMKEIAPDVFIAEEPSSRTRAIRKSLAATD